MEHNKIKNSVLNFGALLSALLLFLSANVSAMPITVSDSQIQTVRAEDFNFNLGTPGYVPGSASTLTVTVQGDFNFQSSEFIAAIDVEGFSLGSFTRLSSRAYDIIDYTLGVDNFNTWEFSLDFVFNSATTALLLANNSLDVFIDFSTEVDAVCGWTGPSNCTPNEGNPPFAAVSYTFNEGTIPEPSILALFGLGLFGLGVSRRKTLR